MLQERPPSPLPESREVPVSPSRPGPAKVSQATEATGAARSHQWGRGLQPPDSPRSSMRDLPPLSPSLSRRAASPVLPLSPSPPQARGPEKPCARRRDPLDSLSAASLSCLRGRSPSPTWLVGERKPSCGVGLSPAYSLGSLTLPTSSPHQSPRARRKMSGELPLPGPLRERKPSVSELSGQEGGLLQFHWWQRQERLREQEVERLVSGAGAGLHVSSWGGWGLARGRGGFCSGTSQ